MAEGDFVDPNFVSEQVVHACFEVHRALGPGLVERAYEEALAHELRSMGLRFLRQPLVEARYKGIILDVAYRADLVVESLVVVELKAVEQVLPVHAAQLLTYLRVGRLPIGLLVNFNVRLIRDGIRRLANGAPMLPPLTKRTGGDD